MSTERGQVEVLWGGKWIEPIGRVYERHPRRLGVIYAKVIDRLGNEVSAAFSDSHWRFKQPTQPTP